MIPALRFLVVGLAINILGLAGCGGGQPEGTITPQASALHEVADLLRATTGPDGRGPTRLTDLAKLESYHPRGYQAIKTGEVVVLWGAKMPGEGEAKPDINAVIAYEKKTPTEGGFVLLQNGTVKEMTADEFKTAPKAQ